MEDFKGEPLKTQQLLLVLKLKTAFLGCGDSDTKQAATFFETKKNTSILIKGIKEIITKINQTVNKIINKSVKSNGFCKLTKFPCLPII